MKVLIACEQSGTVRDAFRARGHDAWSCDILPANGYHIQGDVLKVLYENWDLVIAHPPCDHLAVSGARWFPEKIADGRQQAAIEFFMKFVECAPRVCIENPKGVMSTKYRRPDQIVHPWWFGEEATKGTCLWLHNLPLLEPTNVVGKGKRHITKSGKSIPEWYNLPQSKARAGIRSKTFVGLAEAMANSWDF